MKEKVCTSVLGILESDESRSRGLIGIWTVTFGWMLGVTYPLWGSDVQFPQIPSCSFASQLPANLDQIFFLALLVTLSILAAVNLFGLDWLRIDLLKRNRSWFVRLTAGFALALVILLVVQNQHRFLPWVTQGILILAGLVLFSQRDFIRFTQMLCISIYIYSAISKYDESFVSGIGGRMFEVPFLAWMTDVIEGGLRNLMILSFPTIELLIGIGLCFEKTRKISVVFGVVMHITLMLMLGPLGLQNAGSVLVWNLFFAVQLPLLFYQRKKVLPDRPENGAIKTTLPVETFAENVDRFLPKQFWVRILFILVTFFPMASRFNWIDHWSGWELYASSSSYCTLRVASDEILELPSPIPYLMTGQEDLIINGDKDERVYVNLFGWSLRELNAPIYPQDRFQLAVCVAILEKYHFRAFELNLYSKSNWWTGSRDSKTFYRLDEVKMFLAEFKGASDVR
jgi:hypothetical protein